MGAKKSVVVVGGGISGLTSAYELVKSGYTVTILEKNNWLGGRSYPFTRGAFRGDAGAQLIGENYKYTHRLLDELDLKGDLLKLKEPSAAIYLDGKISLLNLRGLFKYPKLGFREKIDLLRLLKTVRDVGDKKHLGFTNLDNEKYFNSLSVAEWTIENFSEKLLEYFVQPSLTALTLTDPERLSAFYGLTLLFSDLKNSCTLKNGLSSLVSVLLKQLKEKGVEIKTGCEVKKIVVEDDEVRSVEYETLDERKTIDTPNVICSTPTPVIEKILPSLSPNMMSLLSKVEYSKGLQILIALDKRVWDKTWAILMPRSEFKDIAMIAESTIKCSTFAPPGKGLMEVYVYGSTAEKLSNRDDEEASKFAIEMLKNLFPKIGDRVLWSEVLRWEKVVPVHPPSFFSAWKEAMTSTKGLFLAGDYLYPPSLESAVYSGIKASESIIKENGF